RDVEWRRRHQPEDAEPGGVAQGPEGLGQDLHIKACSYVDAQEGATHLPQGIPSSCTGETYQTPRLGRSAWPRNVACLPPPDAGVTAPPGVSNRRSRLRP